MDVRIGNVTYLAGRPYRSLSQLSFAHYAEYPVHENARRFVEGELDIALIPVTTFAMHGSYTGLDFGIACEGDTNLLRLFAHSPVPELETIFVYQDSSASSLLLRLLLVNHWKSSPRIVPVAQDYLPQDLEPSEGLLINRGRIMQAHLDFAVQEDPVRIWSRLTGCPFVFLIWAARPGLLTGEQHIQLYDALFRCSRASIAGVDYTDDHLTLKADTAPTLYLSDHEKRGLEYALQEAYAERLLPEMEYQPCRLSLVDRTPRYFTPKKGISEILEGVVSGNRLTVRDGIRLAEEAPLSELALAAEAMQQSHSPVVRRVVSLRIPDTWWNDLSQLTAEAERYRQEYSVTRLLLLPPIDYLEDFERFLSELRSLYQSTQCVLEGLNAASILSLSRSFGLPIREVCSSLVAAGLEVLSPEGGSLLLESRTTLCPESCRAADWLRVVKWIHRYSGKSRCTLRMSSQDSWEDRVLHLQQLRALQDLNPGFESFSLNPASDQDVSLEDRVRALLLSRIFLDNVALLEGHDREGEFLFQPLSLCFGLDQIRTEIDPEAAPASSVLWNDRIAQPNGEGGFRIENEDRLVSGIV